MKRAAPNGTLTIIRSQDINRDTNPIIFHIVSCYEEFYSKFSQTDGNYKNSYVFCNSAFKRNANSNQLLDINFFGREFYEGNKFAIRSLRLCDFFRNNSMIELDELHDSGLAFTPAVWIRLQAAGRLAVNRMKKNNDSDNITLSIEEFLTKSKKGSKKIRKILDTVPTILADPNNLQIVRTFRILTGTAPQTIGNTKMCLNAWGRPALQNNMREFLFKQRTNQLSLNNRLNAFDATVDPRCNFCRIIDHDTTTRDSFAHVFFECPVTENLLRHFCSIFEPHLDIETETFKNLYWYGHDDGILDSGQYVLLIMDCFRFILWSFKKRRKIPNWLTFERELLFLIETTASRNIGLKNGILNTNLIANFLRVRG